MTQNNTAVAIRQQPTGAIVDSGAAKSLATTLIAHKGVGVFPQNMTDAQAVEMARVALAYSLDPFLAEIMLYQGNLYVTYRGRLRKAQEHPAFDGIEEPEALNDAERKAFRVEDGELMFRCRVWRKDRRLPFVGYGRAGGSSDKNPISKAPAGALDMAMERAKRRALTDAFALPLPNAEDADYRVETLAPDPSRIIDMTTGEIQPSPIRPDQIKAIHAIATALKWPDSEYRQMLQDTFGVDTSKALSEADASAVIDLLAKEQAAAVDQAEREKHAAEAAALNAEVEAKGGARRAQRMMDDDGENVRATYADVLGKAIMLHGVDPAEWAVSGDETDTQIRDMLARLRSRLEAQS